MMKFADFCAMIEEKAPLKCAYEWDNSGINIKTHDEVARVLVCLDITEQVIAEAADIGADTILSHHPLLFKPQKRLSCDGMADALAIRAIQAGLNVYAAHTSFDCAPDGMNVDLARKLGLVSIVPLAIEREERLKKLVVFVPEEAAERVKRALFDAGAGCIGAYSDVCFAAPGTGEFLPGAGADPYIGAVGRHESVRELRIECVVKEEALRAVLAAAREVHPYEEPVIDVYELAYPAQQITIGTVGELEMGMGGKELAALVKNSLGAACVRTSGEKSVVRRVACLGGSGGDFLGAAKAAGAEALVTGEAKYNQFIDAAQMGIMLIEAGHFDTEKGFIDYMMAYLQKRQNEVEYNISVRAAQSAVRPYAVL